MITVTLKKISCPYCQRILMEAAEGVADVIRCRHCHAMVTWSAS